MSRNSILLAIAVCISCAFSAIPPIANQRFDVAVTGLGYYVEEHNITTADDYINTYFRFRNTSFMNQTLPVVYLQHGLLDCGDDWVVNDPNLAPGLLIANAGFDVWVGNTRGNDYSLGHVYYNSRDPKSPYWLFSWQEMSLYDLPAAFQYINNVTGQKINYVGHSQGTIIMFAALTRRDPIITPLLENFCALGPVAYVNHCTSPVVKLAEQKEVANIILRDEGKFFFVDQIERYAMETVCETANPLCVAVIKQISDFNTTVDNMARLDVFVGHAPAGTSYQNMDYWYQLTQNTQFQMYDYGTNGNLQHYNQSTPPVMNLGNIDIPVHLFTGYYDELADPTDVETLISQLTGSPNVTVKSYPYGHLTYLWGLNTSMYVNDVLAIITPQAQSEIVA
jgi:pimeloyl-ACP methyl ester carboxylesterase